MRVRKFGGAILIGCAFFLGCADESKSKGPSPMFVTELRGPALTPRVLSANNASKEAAFDAYLKREEFTLLKAVPGAPGKGLRSKAGKIMLVDDTVDGGRMEIDRLILGWVENRRFIPRDSRTPPPDAELVIKCIVRDYDEILF